MVFVCQVNLNAKGYVSIMQLMDLVLIWLRRNSTIQIFCFATLRPPLSVMKYLLTAKIIFKYR